jgi:hypothetical protein
MVLYDTLTGDFSEFAGTPGFEKALKRIFCPGRL